MALAGDDLFDDLELELPDFDEASPDASLPSTLLLLPPDAWLLDPSEPPQPPAPLPLPGAGAGASPAQPPAPASTLSVLRCLDPTHPSPCGYCSPAPAEAEAGDYELVGEGAKEGGLKKLRHQLIRTPEWNSRAARDELAAALEARSSAGRSGAREALAAVLRGKRTRALTKQHLLLLARAWGYASTLWLRHGRASRRAAAAAGTAAAAAPGAAAAVPSPESPLPPGGADDAGVPLAALSAAARPATLRPEEVRLLGGGYPWLLAPATPAAGAAAAAAPSAFLAAASREAAAALSPLAAAAGSLLAGGRAREAAEACARIGAAFYFGPGDADHVARCAGYYEERAAEWDRLAAAAAAAAAAEEAAEEAAAAAGGGCPYSLSSHPLAPAAPAAAGARWRSRPPPPPPQPPQPQPQPQQPAGAAPCALHAPLRSLAAESRRHATHNCAVAFRRHPALLAALRSGALPSAEHLLTGECALPPQTPPHQQQQQEQQQQQQPSPAQAAAVEAGTDAFTSEMFRAFCCLFELIARAQLLLAEARVAGAPARGASLVAPVVRGHLAGAGAGLRARAAWMRAALEAAQPGGGGGGRPPPHSRLLFVS